MPSSSSTKVFASLDGKRLAVLQISVLIVALCGIVYELLIATVSSYLLGDSVRQFSITIGLFMAAMGLGAYITKFLNDRLINSFILIEIVIACVGGLSGVILFSVFPFQVFYLPTMYTLIVVIGALVGMEIPILTRILSVKGGLKKSIADVLSLDYFGALIGSVAFPLFLLPFFGLFRASFMIGLTNIIVAFGNVLMFRGKLNRSPQLIAIVSIAFVILAAGFYHSAKISAYAEGQLYADQIIFKKQTPYQKIILTRNEQTGKHRMYLDGHIQFAESDEYRYHEALVHPIMSAGHSRKRVLVLGGGDGMAVREILKYDVSQVELVDIDPEVTRLSMTMEPLRRINEDSLNDTRVTITNTDAWQFVKQCKEPFDLIVIDLPDPHNEALNKLYSVEFYRLVRNCLTHDGLLVTQSASPLLTGRVFWSIATTLQAADFQTFSYKANVPSFSGNWGFTLAAASGPAPEWFDISENKTRYLTTELMRTAGEFGKDEQLSDALVNSIFEPRLYITYNEDISQW